MNKLNSAYDPYKNRISSNLIYETLNAYFMELLPPAPPIDDACTKFNNFHFEYLLKEGEKNFYESDYFLLTPQVDITDSPYLNKYIDSTILPKQKIGYYEKDILEVIFDEKDKRINLLTGYVGWGKSTALKNAIFYLLNCTKKPNKILPIYFDFNLHIDDINDLPSNKIKGYIHDSILLPYLRKICMPYLKIDNDEFWDFCLRQTEYSNEALKLENLSLIKSEEQIANLKKEIRYKILSNNKNLVFSCLKYLVDVKEVKVVFALDNIDPLRYKLTSRIIKLFHKLCQSYFFKVLLPMRPNTLAEMKNKRYGIHDALDNVEIQFTLPNPADIILNNKEKIKKKIKENGQNIKIMNNIIKNEDIILLIEAMFELISREKTKSLFANIARGDMKEWGKLLRTCFSSGLIPEHKVIAKYYSKAITSIEDTDYDSYNPEWIPFTAIITDNKKTYFSKGTESGAKDRICNVFCNKIGSLNKQLIRLHILSFLDRRDSTDIEVLQNYYLDLFPTSAAIDESLFFAVRIMVNTGLIKSNRFHKIDKTKWVKKMGDLSINKNCGVYYLKELIFDNNYLKFMKDDTYIPLLNQNEIICNIQNSDFNVQFQSIVHFIRFLFSLEKEMIKKFTPLQKDIYLENFSPNGSVFYFSLILVKSQLDYSNWNKYINDYNKNLVNKLYEEIIDENSKNFKNKTNVI